MIDYDDMEQEIKTQQRLGMGGNFGGAHHQESEEERSEEFFDKLDFVFIDGDQLSFCPWLVEYDQVRLLIKNCIKTNKCLFGSHIVFQTLIYLKSLGS